MSRSPAAVRKKKNSSMVPKRCSATGYRRRINKSRRIRSHDAKQTGGIHPFNRQVRTIMQPYADALTLAMERELGDVDYKCIHSNVISDNERRGLALRVLNKYAAVHKKTNRSATEVARSSLKDISALLAHSIRTAYEDLAANRAKGSIHIDRAQVSDTREHWKYRFWNYYGILERNAKRVTFGPRGNLYIPHPFECVFAAGFEPFVLGHVHRCDGRSVAMDIPIIA